MSYGFSVVTLPRLAFGANNDEALALANTNRDMRLCALKTSPEGFARTYEEEVQFDVGHFLERLSTPKMTHFVALINSGRPDEPTEDGSDIHRLVADAWMGTVVLLGPQDPTPGGVTAGADPFSKMTATKPKPEGSQNGEDEKPQSRALHYHLNGMFVNPAARRCGLGKKLLLAALQRAEDDCRIDGCDRLECTIFVSAENEAARKTYESVGFVVTATERYLPSSFRPGEKPGLERVALKLAMVRELRSV